MADKKDARTMTRAEYEAAKRALVTSDAREYVDRVNAADQRAIEAKWAAK